MLNTKYKIVINIKVKNYLKKITIYNYIYILINL